MLVESSSCWRKGRVRQCCSTAGGSFVMPPSYEPAREIPGIDMPCATSHGVFSQSISASVQA